MTLGDRVCVLRKGKIQQVASPRELYEQPVNLFVAGFIGSPPMNFLPATLEGDQLKMPFGKFELAEERAKAVAGRDLLLSASAPSTSTTPRSSTAQSRWAHLRRGSTSPSGWATSSTPTSPTRPPRPITTQLRELSRELDSEELRTQAVVSIDSTSRIREGREAEFWLDARKVHVFDPATGENLTRDAEAGAELTRLAKQDRVEQVEEAGASGRRQLGRRGLNRAGEGPADGEWWRSAVVYEVYLRSFADSDGDGVGDLGGLPVAAALPGGPRRGRPVDHPVVPVADGRRRVRRRRLLRHRSALRHARGRRCAARRGARARPAGDHRPGPEPLLDEHPWFAARSRPGRARPARPVLLPRRPGRRRRSRPNNWISRSADRRGPACPRPTGPPVQWFLHLFAPSSPTSTGTTQASGGLDAVLRFWFDRGIDGIRIDAAPAMAKVTGLPDAGQAPPLFESGPWAPALDVDEVHDILRRWRRSGLLRGGRLFVAEAVVNGPDRLSRTCGPDEMHTSFNFDSCVPVGRRSLRPSSTPAWPRSRRGRAGDLGAVQPRRDPPRDALRARRTPGRSFRSRRCGAARRPGLGLRRARAATLLTLALPGSAYLYQGEELGLPEVEDLPEEVLQDPTWGARAHRPRPGRLPGAPSVGRRLAAVRFHRGRRRALAAAAGGLGHVDGGRAACGPGLDPVPLPDRPPPPPFGPGVGPMSSTVLDRRGRRRPRLRPGHGVAVRGEPLRREPLDVRGTGEVLLASGPGDGRLPPDTAAWFASTALRPGGAASAAAARLSFDRTVAGARPTRPTEEHVLTEQPERVDPAAVVPGRRRGPVCSSSWPPPSS